MVTGKIYQAQGVIIKRRNIGEADRIITVFSRKYGKFNAIAKGVRKITSRRSGHIELFCEVNLTLHRSGTLDILTEASAISPNNRLSQKLTRIGLAYYVAELIDVLMPERQENDEIFILVVGAFHNLALIEDEIEHQKFAEVFSNNLLQKLGYLPEERWIKFERIPQFIEQIIERKLKSVPLLTRITNKS
jgi:DNA repair protein RecO (recombination protein O)